MRFRYCSEVEVRGFSSGSIKVQAGLKGAWSMLTIFFPQSQLFLIRDRANTIKRVPIPLFKIRFPSPRYLVLLFLLNLTLSHPPIIGFSALLPSLLNTHQCIISLSHLYQLINLPLHSKSRTLPHCLSSFDMKSISSIFTSPLFFLCFFYISFFEIFLYTISLLFSFFF